MNGDAPRGAHRPVSDGQAITAFREQLGAAARAVFAAAIPPALVVLQGGLDDRQARGRAGAAWVLRIPIRGAVKAEAPVVRTARRQSSASGSVVVEGASPIAVRAAFRLLEAVAEGRLMEVPPDGALVASEIPWQTARELAADTPSEIVWAWEGYLALGTVAEVDAKLKTGKTTFVGLLIRSLLTGQRFLNRTTLSGPVVYLTEEGNRTFRSMLRRADLLDRSDLHVLSRRRAAELTWEAAVAAARAKVIETGAAVLIVDTLSKWVGFREEQENSSGVAMASMLPLQVLAEELGVVIIVLRHDRKSGGEVGESARGSSQMGGDVDMILQLTRMGGKGRERWRCLRALGRFDDTPEQLTIVLTPDGYRVMDADPREAAAETLLGMLPDSEADAVAVTDLLPELKEYGHGRSVVYAAAQVLVNSGRARERHGDRRRRLLWRSMSMGGT
jgi:hypothetical protein